MATHNSTRSAPDFTPTARLVELYLAGASVKSLARRLNRCASGLSKRLGRAGVALRTNYRSNRVYQVDESAFDGVTDESAYWAGFLMADGNICDSGGRSVISVSVSVRDHDHLEHFRTFLKSTHPVFIFRQSVNSKTGGSGRMSQFSVHSRNLVQALARYGVAPRKSLTACAGDIVADHPRFWAGMVDGDGWLGCKSERRPTISLCSASRRLAEQFLAFSLKRLPGCKACVYTTTAPGRRPMHRVSVTTRHAVAMAAILYPPGAFGLSRKVAVARNIARCEIRRYSDWGNLTRERMNSLYAELGTWAAVERHLGMPTLEGPRIRKKLGCLRGKPGAPRKCHQPGT